MPIRNFPHLDPEEFAEVCHHFERRYRQAVLGSSRQLWRLQTCTALGVWAGPGAGRASYIQITRPLTPLPDDSLTGALSQLAISQCKDIETDNEAELEDMAIEDEDSDEAVLPRSRRGADPSYVTYEIHYHPTYRVPCLWFSLQGLPEYERLLDINNVFRFLVPDQFKPGLQQSIGRVGGISIDHHPLTGIPTFFVHPCLLADTLAEFPCSGEEYLMIWIGLTGGCVGLWIPNEMGMSSPQY